MGNIDIVLGQQDLDLILNGQSLVITLEEGIIDAEPQVRIAYDGRKQQQHTP